jgi:putative membrane protein
MKVALRLGFLLGLSLLIALVVRQGAEEIFSSVSRVGLVLVWLLPLNALTLLLDTSGWRLLIPERPAASSLLLIAAIRQAVNRLLPVANVGGEIVGIRLLAARGTDSAWAAASVTVEVLLTLISQYLFVAIGLLCLLNVTGTPHLVTNVLLGLGASLPCVAIAAALLRHGSIFERIERLATGLLGPDMLTRTLGVRAPLLDEAIRRLLETKGRLLVVIGWQLSGLILGSAENWLILRSLGHPVGVGTAIVLESLTLAARSIVFLVPGGLGVQEVSLIGLGRVLGLGGDLAIALSLAKRVRELLFCLPALLAWQWLEAQRGLQHGRLERNGGGR